MNGGEKAVVIGAGVVFAAAAVIVGLQVSGMSSGWGRKLLGDEIADSLGESGRNASRKRWLDRLRAGAIAPPTPTQEVPS
jgi:hypothetical protein